MEWKGTEAMKFIKIVIQIALLYAFAWLGGQVQEWLHLGIPGSIIGLLLLFILLVCRIVPVSWIETGSTTILFYLPLFFVPATVGVMNHLDLFAGIGLLLVASVIVSTLITIVIAGHASQWLAKWTERTRRQDDTTSIVDDPSSRSSGQTIEGETTPMIESEQQDTSIRSDPSIDSSSLQKNKYSSNGKQHGKKGAQL